MHFVGGSFVMSHPEESSQDRYHKQMHLRIRNAASHLSFAFSLALLTVAGHSQISNQIGIYATPTFTRASNSTPDSGLYAFLGANQTSRIFSGASLGVYDQFFHTGLVDAGVDLRGSLQKGGNAHLNEFLIGARAAFHPVVFPMHPYVEVLGGVGGTRAATNPVYKSKVAYGAFAGLDYPVGKFVDLRVIEVGYSSLETISTASVTGAAVQPGASKLLNFSAGIVFRLPQHIIP